MEDLNISGRPTFKEGLSLNDLIRNGATFEIQGEREDFPEHLSEEEDMSDSELPDDAIKPNPCQRSFFEMKAEMTEISSYMYKKIISAGSSQIPDGSRVSIHYNGYFEKSPLSFDSTYMRGKPTEFFLGRDEVLTGLEQAVKTMKLHEESHFIISWQWLYGEHGCLPRIKPKADALFIIRVMDYKELTIPMAPTPNDGAVTQFFNKLQDFFKYNILAKEAFKRGNMNSAISNFQKAIHEIDKCPLKDEQEEKVYKDSIKKTYLNLAVCYNNVNKPKRACSMLNDLKKLDGFDGNAKALYHEGKALEALNDYKRARASYVKAKNLSVNDSNVLTALRNIDEKIEAYKKEERRLAQNALGMLLKKTTNAEKKDKKDNFDPQSKNVANVNAFLESNLQTLVLPSPLSGEEIAALRSLESKMGFKLQITNNMSEQEIRLVRTEKKENSL